ncbi:MAG: flagellar hook-length control protein FliK [Pseudomonadota bacterium]
MKSAQAEDRRTTGDLAIDRLNADGSKSGQSSEQGSQFSDGRGEDRRGQQSSPLIFTAGKDATADARPTVTADRSQNSGFANALLGGGQTAELDSNYDQMPARLRIAVANGVKQLTVHLQPANLGSMEVRLDGTEDGGLRATFLVQRPETLDLLQRDARVLERALSDAGVSVDRDSLNFSLSDQGNRNGGLASDGEQSGSGIRDGQADDASSEDDLIEQDIPIDTAAIIEAGRIDVHI